jgi:S1-C subfamily serine protease
VIVKYQGQPVGDFDSLTELISHDEAGDTVTMVIRRGVELLSVEVTLGEWD